jgi:predicted transcriptional regulator
MMADETLLTLTADIVSAHVGNNTVAAGDVPAVIAQVYGAMTELGKPQEPAAIAQEPAVSVRSSVKPDYIVCLEDGKKLKMLKRHLQTHHSMTPKEYKAKWNLPADYPTVASSYAEKRKGLALKIGLGKKKAEASPAPVKAAVKPKATRKVKAKVSA